MKNNPQTARVRAARQLGLAIAALLSIHAGNGQASNAGASQTTAGGKCRAGLPSKTARDSGPDLQAYIEAHREILARSRLFPGSG